MSTELITLQNWLRDETTLQVALRGAGKSAFLYIRSPNRAAEISLDEEGLFIECWDVSDEESGAASVKSELVRSASEAKKILSGWLQ